MENNSYNSLEEKLKQTGIIQQGNEQVNIFLDTPQDDIIVEQSFVEIPEDFKKRNENTKKRLNEYDMNLLKDKPSIQKISTPSSKGNFPYKSLYALWTIKSSEGPSTKITLRLKTRRNVS